jgi:hypothetical protein
MMPAARRARSPGADPNPLAAASTTAATCSESGRVVAPCRRWCRASRARSRWFSETCCSDTRSRTRVLVYTLHKLRRGRGAAVRIPCGTPANKSALCLPILSVRERCPPAGLSHMGRCPNTRRITRCSLIFRSGLLCDRCFGIWVSASVTSGLTALAYRRLVSRLHSPASRIESGPNSDGHHIDDKYLEPM